MNSAAPKDFIEGITRWFNQEKRVFPWRDNPTPYAVWVSEVMLQQTRASVVIPYFQRWLKVFPDVYALSQATEEEVLKQWEGLGYYSRARSLHHSAKVIVSQFGGEIPREEKELRQLKGIGSYTAGAIRSFAFHEKSAAVDGNVLRLMSRYWGIIEDISEKETIRTIENQVEKLLPENDLENLSSPAPWVVMESLIELGALVCSKVPLCQKCPVKNSCYAFLHKKTEQIPFRKRKISYEQLFRFVPVIRRDNDHALLVQKVGKNRIMADLYEFPYFPLEKKADLSAVPFFGNWSGDGQWYDGEVHFEQMVQLQKLAEKELFLSLHFVSSLSLVHHAFTRFRVQLYPMIFISVDSQAEKSLSDAYSWKKVSELQKVPFSAGYRRILQEYIRFQAIAR